MVNTRMRNFAELVMAELSANGSGVAAYYEAAAAKQHQSRRKILWVAPRGRVISPRQAGSKPNELSVDPLLTELAKVREETVWAWISAETRDVAEHLLDNTIAAIEHIESTATSVTYRWLTEEDGSAGNTNRSSTVQLEIVLPLPVPWVITHLDDEDLSDAGEGLTTVVDHEEVQEFDADGEV